MNSQTALERVNYFQGQLLSASDFQAEQGYFLARLRRHNRYLHGWGVVSGLTVVAGGSSEITVEPGFAIDCFGNEIDACASTSLAIPGGPDLLFVVIDYTETKTTPTLSAPGLERPETDEPVFTRIREGFRVEIVDADPTVGHKGKGAGTPGCGCIHALCIARLRKNARGWTVEQRGRRPP